MQRTVHVAGVAYFCCHYLAFPFHCLDMNKQPPQTKIFFPMCLVSLIVDRRNVKRLNGS